MNRGQSSPSSNESAVPETAPIAKSTAVAFDQVFASANAFWSPVRIHRRSTISSITGNAMPTDAKSM